MVTSGGAKFGKLVKRNTHAFKEEVPEGTIFVFPTLELVAVATAHNQGMGKMLWQLPEVQYSHSRRDNSYVQQAYFIPLISVWCMTAFGNQRWMEQSRFGMMFHYEAFVDHLPESYNRHRESFDVKEFVQAVESTQADYIIFVIGQHWGKYCCPK